jgi:hypothetical protein
VRVEAQSVARAELVADRLVAAVAQAGGALGPPPEPEVPEQA